MEPEDQVNKRPPGIIKSLAERWEADSRPGSGVKVSICATCQHKWPGVAKCWAFSRGIPEAILKGEASHDFPRPDLGQRNDLVFQEAGTAPKVDMAS